MNYLTQNQLISLTDKLTYYDVEQKAWEQEPNGFEANAHHVLTHLTKDVVNKDYTKRKLVEEEIAPDAVAYAIRLRRWAGIHPNQPVNWSVGTEQGSDLRRLGRIPLNLAFTLEANALLATHLHDLDHHKTRERAIENRSQIISGASDLLIVSADAAANQYRFSIIEAFDNRLAQLRERFDIPQPTVKS